MVLNQKRSFIKHEIKYKYHFQFGRGKKNKHFLSSPVSTLAWSITHNLFGINHYSTITRIWFSLFIYENLINPLQQYIFITKYDLRLRTWCLGNFIFLHHAKIRNRKWIKITNSKYNTPNTCVYVYVYKKCIICMCVWNMFCVKIQHE